MLLLMILVHLMQEPPSHDHSVEKTTDSTEKFQPIPAGNILEYGSFSIKIPEGMFYAGEMDAHHLFYLLGTDYIPSCSGIFFSGSNTWEYGIAVQYIKIPVKFEPILSPEEWTDRFTKRDLFSQEPVEQDGVVIIPPHYDMEDKTFTLGIRYTNKENEPYVMMRKMWVAGPDALILNLRATESSMSTEYELIDTTFNAVKVSPSEDLVDAITDPISYTVPLGMSQAPMTLEELPEEKLPFSVILVSIGLALMAGALFFGAYKLNKAKTEKEATNSTPKN